MSKLVRTPTRAEGGITPEEKSKMDAIAKKWIAKAFCTGDTDKEKLTQAIKDLYKVSGLKEPRVVIVPSPFVMACAYGLAAGWWYLRNKGIGNSFFGATRDATLAATYDATLAATRDATLAATRDATHDATRGATYDATDAATYGATYGATYDATDAATRAATRDATLAATYDATLAATRDATHGATLDATLDATRDATYGATRDATHGATLDATYIATDGATDAATLEATRDATLDATRDATYGATYGASIKKHWLKTLAKKFGGKNYTLLLSCINRWGNVYQCGNMWAAWQSYADGCHNVLGLTGLKCWKAHEPYRQAALYGGYRVMHPEFCIVSEFPEALHIDDQNRAHNDSGPSHRWKDGFEIYHIHGIKFYRRIVMHPETITIDEIKSQTNQEIRRILVERFGVDKYLSEIGAKVIDADMRGIEGAGARCLMEDDQKQKWFVGTDGSTDRVYYMNVPNTVSTCKQAHEVLAGFSESKIQMEG